MHRKTIVGAFALALFTVPPGSAKAAQLTTLTYNVRGLPPQVIEDRTAGIAAIAPLLEDFHNAGGVIEGIDSVALLQELFYHDH